MKNSNKRFNTDYAAEEVERQMVPMLELPPPVGEPIPEPEETFEEMQSGNVLPKIEAILKEPVIPDFQLPPNDGFGEEDPEQARQMLGASGPHTLTHSALDASASAPAPAQDPEQAWQLLRDLALEQMLGASGPHTLTHSALDASASAQDPEQAWRLLRDLALEQMLGASGPHMLTHSALDASASAPAPAQDPEQAWRLLRDLALEQMLGASGPHTLTHSALDASASAQGPEQAWQLLRDLALEQMLVASGPHTLTHSALDASAPAQAAELVPGLELHNTNTMERMAESTAQDLLREESDKEIPIPEIPPPDLPIPNEKEKPLPEPEEPGPAPEEPAEVPAAAKAVPQEPEMLTLESLEEEEPQANPRRMNKLIIDKNQQLSKRILRGRPENIDVNLRCEEFPEDIAEMRQVLLHRAAFAGNRFTCGMARPLGRLLFRNLTAAAHDDREMEKKKLRCGYRAFRQSQSQNFVPSEPEIVKKENIPDKTIPARTEEPPIIPNIEIQRASDPERVLKPMWQEASLAELQMTQPEQPPVEVEVESRQCGSASSESAPGSLDTAGDSDHTTDSEGFIRTETAPFHKTT